VIAYIDASVLLRVVLKQDHPLEQWDDLEGGIASSLVTVEAHRTLDQLWHRHELTDSELAQKRVLLMTFLPHLEFQVLDDRVLDLAAQPLPTSLATLDAIHLATAMMYRAGQPTDERPISFATHDVQLARAAKAMHFDVIGVTL
jgi:predicted nucleic acid-binding protein